MNPLYSTKKQTALVFLVALGLACFGLSPSLQAVVPPPDGGYPGGNTAEGQAALLSLTSGGYNTAVGWLSLRSNSTGQFNTAIGAGALLANTANDNTATGAGALLSDTTGAVNTAIGTSALFRNTIGGANTANGAFALSNNTSGSNNTADGDAALLNNTIGSHNNALGYFAGVNVITASGVICIGADGANVNNSCYIGQIFGQPIDPNSGIPVGVDSSGKLGTFLSSRRFKHDIKLMDRSSEAILALKPATFQYKSDAKGTPQYGLIAEEVAEVNPDLVVRDKYGELLTVRYEAVNAMLLNEFLKEHRKVEEQETTITQLKNNFRATVAQLTARLDEQAARIQKVSAQIEMDKPAPQVVNNP